MISGTRFKDGALRRLQHAGPIPDGRARRTQSYPRQGRAFFVSHMGQVTVPANDTTSAALEADDRRSGGSGSGGRGTRCSRAQWRDSDDLLTRLEDMFFIVVNAACKDADIKHLQAHLGSETVRVADRSALLALQGPSAASAMAEIAPDSTRLAFMQAARMEVGGHEAIVTRSGYTGEDGFEISVADTAADAVARKLLEHPDVEPIGLGARDSLRLEAGCLCLLSLIQQGGGGSRMGDLETAEDRGRISRQRDRAKQLSRCDAPSPLSRTAAHRPGKEQASPIPTGRSLDMSRPVGSAPASADRWPWGMSRSNLPNPEQRSI